MTAISGGTSLASFMTKFRQYRDDASVSAILCDIDSPGGSVFMLRESFDEILKAREVKPIVAVVNPSCCSAAYYLACAFSEIVCTPSGEVGSVGCFMVHEDWSQANEQMGVKPTYVAYGKFKTEANPDEPLEDEARTYLQSLVDAFGGDFVKAVAKGRGKTVSDVTSDFGQGRVLLAKQALEVGMVDRIDTFENVLGRMVSRRGRLTADADVPAIVATDEPAHGVVAEAPAVTEPATEAAPAPPFPAAREGLRRELELQERL
jgi:capsid assembly protease